jgi:hypothetical protein
LSIQLSLLVSIVQRCAIFVVGVIRIRFLGMHWHILGTIYWGNGLLVEKLKEELIRNMIKLKTTEFTLFVAPSDDS